ncbi:MAG: isopentenyl-diphosphate Delta-isomerase [Candidatus Micrarchaeia archaeon]|jgi:isopentenyl-diphosphate delta-isomerase
MKKVILVDKNNNEIGEEEKQKAHLEGKLHRAFSILVFNSKKELLIHKRESSKYHSGGLWTNTVCSHPKPKEKIEDAVHRRLKEEMGFDTELKEIGQFIYKTKIKDLTEHELDYVFLGFSDKKPNPDPKEIEDYMYLSLEDLKKDMKINPNKYTFWFKIIIKDYEKEINTFINS